VKWAATAQDRGGDFNYSPHVCQLLGRFSSLVMPPFVGNAPSPDAEPRASLKDREC